MYSEQDLIMGLKQRNILVFDKLFEKYWEKLYKEAFSKLKSRELAKETVQDLFITLWEKCSTFSVQIFTIK